MTAQVVVDTVILQPVLPASGLSACPGEGLGMLALGLQSERTGSGLIEAIL